MSLSSLVAYHCVVPLFGVVLSGTAGVAATVVLGLVLAYLVWGTYRLQRTAWWGLLLFGLAGTANMAVTFSRVDMMKLYERMGIPAEQLDLIRKMGVADMMSRWGPAMTVTGGIAWLGYLLFVRRYFVQKNAGQQRPKANAAPRAVPERRARRLQVPRPGKILRFATQESPIVLVAGTRSSMDRASVFGTEGWGFESLRVHLHKTGRPNALDSPEFVLLAAPGSTFRLIPPTNARFLRPASSTYVDP